MLEKVELDMGYGKGIRIIKIIPNTYVQGSILSALHTVLTKIFVVLKKETQISLIKEIYLLT